MSLDPFGRWISVWEIGAGPVSIKGTFIVDVGSQLMNGIPLVDARVVRFQAWVEFGEVLFGI